MILHNRKSIRLKGFDYSSERAYFVTICTQNRELLFGSVGVDPCVDPALGTIIQWFKTMTTNNYIENVKNSNWAPFNKRIWQRNYYEHIIRNDIELSKIREYIGLNPSMWDRDRNNPDSSGAKIR